MIVLMLMTLSVLITFSPNVAAASTTWTSDADFTAPGAGGSTPVFTGTEVVGTGTPARVDIVKDNTDWVNKNPSTSPGVREGPGMTFASSSNVFVLFGGYSTRDLDDTWEYNLTANTWTKITTSPRPAGREWPGLSYDPGQNVVVLFGGVNGTNGFLSDTWEFNVAAGTWSQQSPPTSPPPLVDYPLVYYASQSRHVVFGQDIVSGQMQTWAYNAAAHTWANRTPSGSPSVRSGFAMTYHAARDRVVLFGGAFFMTLLAETWEYNWVSNAWGQVFPSGSPAARAGHSMTYRPVGSVAYLFGGQTSSGQSQETWAYSAAGAWTSVGTNTHPPPRQYAGFADDTTHDVAI
ncbi:MAG TPA: kelch repeat-containing protein, partial [Thermoplasmata archaeon]|nr:kelch repeat-containing protein [Thermoplasmata archaeon]